MTPYDASFLTITIGVDNGISGGLTAICGPSLIRYTPMPIHEVGGKDEVDTRKLVEWLRDFGNHPIQVVVEEPLKHAKSSQAIRSMALNFGKIIGACEARGIPCDRVQVKQWQDIILGKVLAKGMTKVVALKRAKELWPEEGFIPPRCRTPHDGIVDAALIAHYYQTHMPTP